MDVVPIEEVDEGMLLEVKRRFDCDISASFIGDKTVQTNGQ